MTYFPKDQSIGIISVNKNVYYNFKIDLIIIHNIFTETVFMIS